MTDVEQEAAFMRRLDEHRGIVFKVAAAYGRNRDDRDDLVQTIALQAWRSYPRFDQHRVFSTWLYRIALNVAISFYRKQRRDQQQVTSIGDVRPEQAPVSHDDGGDDAVATVRALIDALNELDRALMILYLDDEPYTAIGEILGLSESNVATKISRIKQRLRSEVRGTQRV